MVTSKGTNFSGGNQAFIGYILLFGNTSSMAIYVLLQKKFLFYKDETGKDVFLYPPTTACAWSYGFGALIMALCAIPYGIIKPSVFDLSSNIQFIYPLIYAIFIGSAMCYGLINYATSLTSATVVTAFWPLQVPTSTIESIFVFGEIPFWEEYIGAAFIITGLIVICWVKYRQETKQLKEVINE
jgi:drug/metabolite transporter (DMT)-like permease